MPGRGSQNHRNQLGGRGKNQKIPSLVARSVTPWEKTNRAEGKNVKGSPETMMEGKEKIRALA